YSQLLRQGILTEPCFCPQLDQPLSQGHGLASRFNSATIIAEGGGIVHQGPLAIPQPPVAMNKKTAADRESVRRCLLYGKWDVRQSVLAQAGSDDGHGVDLLGVAAPGQIVDGGVQTLQDGAVSLKGTQTLGDLVADIAGVDVREDEGVGMAGHLGVRALGAGHAGRDGG
ncbi:translation initiation factor IF-3, partial [Dysosmobacter welbionis]